MTKGNVRETSCRESLPHRRLPCGSLGAALTILALSKDNLRFACSIRPLYGVPDVRGSGGHAFRSTTPAAFSALHLSLPQATNFFCLPSLTSVLWHDISLSGVAFAGGGAKRDPPAPGARITMDPYASPPADFARRNLTSTVPSLSDFQMARLTVATAGSCLTDTAIRSIMTFCGRQNSNPSRIVYPEMPSLLLLRQEFVAQREANQTDTMELVNHVRHLFAQCILSAVKHIYIPVYDAIRDHYCLLYIHQGTNRRLMFYIDSVASWGPLGGDAAYYHLYVRDIVEPVRIVLDEVDRQKGLQSSPLCVFGSQLSHLATQTDGTSCGLFVCEYARRLFEHENAADPVSLIQPLTGNLLSLRAEFCTILDICQAHAFPTAAASQMVMYSREREKKLIEMAMPQTAAIAAPKKGAPPTNSSSKGQLSGVGRNPHLTPKPTFTSDGCTARRRSDRSSANDKKKRAAAKKRRQRDRGQCLTDKAIINEETATVMEDATKDDVSAAVSSRLSKEWKQEQVRRRDAEKKRKKWTRDKAVSSKERSDCRVISQVPSEADEDASAQMRQPSPTPAISVSGVRITNQSQQSPVNISRFRLDASRCKSVKDQLRSSEQKRRLRSRVPDDDLLSPPGKSAFFATRHLEEGQQRIRKRLDFTEDAEGAPVLDAQSFPTPDEGELQPAESAVLDASVHSVTVAKRLETFKDKISNRPVFPCCVCHQLNFASNVKRIAADDERRLLYGHPHPLLQGPGHMCKSCANSIGNNVMPKMAARRINLPEVPGELQDLGRMERTLVALRIPFMTIRSLPRGGQVSLRGNFVNIPVALQKSACALPRNLASTETVVVKLKRKKAYRSHYIHEVVRAEKVLRAAQFLVQHSPPYHEEGAHLAQQWSEDVAFASDDESAFEGFHPADVEAAAATDARHPACSIDLSPTPPEESSPVSANKDDESDDAWEEDVPLAEAQIPPAETVVAQMDLDDRPSWDIVIAPGEGMSPTSIFADRNTMAKAFPTIFGGQAMPKIEELNIYWIKFSKWLLGHVDRRVALTVESIFFLFKVVQILQLKSAVQVAMRRGNAKGRVPVSQLLSPDGLEAFVRSDDGYKVLANIRASPSYWQGVQKEIFAMVRQLGKPSFFMSFSAAETRWGALLQSLSETVAHTSLSGDEAAQLSWEAKCRLIRSDPDTCVRYFHSRYGALMSVYLRRGQSGPIGTVEDYVYRVEFQQRGSPHIHSLWWVKGAPKVDDDTDEAVVNFVDAHVTCAVSDDDSLPVSYQSHRHAKTCKVRKGGRRTCRFGFPKPPMRTTTVLRPLPAAEQSSIHTDNWAKVYALLQALWPEARDISFDDFLSELDMTEATYLLAVRSSLNRVEVFLKRKTTEIRINAYNKELLTAWQANMDIQYVVNAYAAAKYIVAYMMKGQRGISNTMKNVVKEVQGGNLSLWTKLRKVANTFLNCVEVSEQEAVWMIRQLPLYRCSRDVIFVSACPLKDRVVLLKPIRELQQLKASDANSCEVESDNVIKRYQRRPLIMQDMCLASFATWYDCVKERSVTGKSREPAESDDDDSTEVSDEVLCALIDDSALNDNDDCCELDETSCPVGPRSVKFEGEKILKRRTYPKVLRSPRFWAKKDKEKHYFEKLMLYLPWRDEGIDLSATPFASLEDKWHDAIRRNPSIFAVMQQYDRMGSLLDAIIEDVRQEDCRTSDAAVGGHAQHVNEIDEAAAGRCTLPDDPPGECVDMLADAGMPPSTTKLDIHSRTMEDSSYKNLVAGLNKEQKILFYDIIYQIKFNEAPVRLFVTGGAGVGKSYLLRALYQYLVRFYTRSASIVDPAAENVLVIAPTGKAAHLIGGYTAHNALRIPVNQSLKEYKKLDADKMNTLRHDLRGIRVLIIDEISMIGYHLLRFIDRRLRDLTDVQLCSFGGLHVLCFGDLFQLRPVKDSYIFQTPANTYEALTDTLWQEFYMAELNTIMRQKEDLEYACTLNRLREGQQTPLDIVALQERSVSPDAVANIISAGTVCVCRTNQRAEALNDARLQSISTLKETFFAIDRSAGGDDTDALCSKVDARFTGGLPGVITVAVGMRVELTINVDTADGLTNGASGIVQGFSKKNDRYYWSQDIIWVIFDEAAVGAHRRQQMRYAFNSSVNVEATDQHHVPLPAWTPIVREVRPVSITRRSTVDRLQMPIRLAAAKTIHRSQGDSYNAVLADFSCASKYVSSHHMHYVALSRVRSATGLSVIGFNPQKISTDAAVKTEMKRLRTVAACQFPLKLPQLNILSRKLTILFHNITSLRANFAYLRKEDSIYCCDALIFAEARVCSDESELFNLEGFNALYLPSRQTRYGLAVYTRSSAGGTLLRRVASDDLSIEIAMMRCETAVVIALYRSPSSDMRQFIDMLQSLLGSLSRTDVVVLVGDFNIDASEPACQSLHTLLSRFSQRQIHTAPTTEAGSYIDKIFVNAANIDGDVLQTYYSFHSPLVVSLPRP